MFAVPNMHSFTKHFRTSETSSRQKKQKTLPNRSECFMCTTLILKKLCWAKKSDTTEYFLYILFIWNSKKKNLIYTDRKQISGCLHYKWVTAWVTARNQWTSPVMGMFTWITVMPQQVYKFIKTKKRTPKRVFCIICIFP